MRVKNKRNPLPNYETEKAKTVDTLKCFKDVNAEDLRPNTIDSFGGSIKEARTIIMGMDVIPFEDKDRDDDNLMFELLTRSGQILGSLEIMKSEKEYLEMNCCRAKERVYGRIELQSALNSLVRKTKKTTS